MNKASVLDLLKGRQRQWASSCGIPFAQNGRVKNLDDNFFVSLHAETLREISDGDGGELGTPEDAGKMYSLWSSSALACNVFDYWRKRPLVPLLNALGLQAVGYQEPRFEQKFRTGVRSARANLDVLLETRESEGLTVAIESKFTEPYQSGEKECLRPSYFVKPKTWEKLPLCRAVAESLTNPMGFEYLDVGQLLKHILGLTGAFGAKRFVLHYLWYDVCGSDAAAKHRDEISRFSSLVANEVHFSAGTYQDVFRRLVAVMSGTPYEAYLRSRYFPET